MEINLLRLQRIAGTLLFQIQPFIFWNARISKAIVFYARTSKQMKGWIWNNRVTAILWNHSSFISLMDGHATLSFFCIYHSQGVKLL